MTPQQIRILDKWLGCPACALLSIFESIRRLLPKEVQQPQKVLFVKLIEMGSTVLAAPSFTEAINRVGKENVFLLLFSRNRAIADLMGLLPAENIIEVDDQSLVRFGATLLSALRRIRREKIDTAIDLEGLTRASAIITWLTGARIRVGYFNFSAEGPYRGRLFNRELNYNFQRHVACSFLAMTRAAFLASPQLPLLKESVTLRTFKLPKFIATPEDKRVFSAKIERTAGAAIKRPIIILNPNCSDLLPLRRWPSERFIQLGKLILGNDPSATVVISGAPDEKAAGLEIARAIDPTGQRCLSLAGETSFRELLVLQSISDVLVSNDSGPCHFAALTDIAVVSLFGPETPQLYGPLGKSVRSISADFACSPCVNMLNHRFSPCRDNRCMHAISVEQVYAALMDLIDARTSYEPVTQAPKDQDRQDI